MEKHKSSFKAIKPLDFSKFGLIKYDRLTNYKLEDIRPHKIGRAHV